MSKPPNEAVWRALWMGEPALPTHRKRRIYVHIPSSPRCRICLAPFRGLGGWLMRLLGSRPSAKNPNFCSICEETARTHPGGAEVELALLFADPYSVLNPFPPLPELPTLFIPTHANPHLSLSWINLPF